MGTLIGAFAVYMLGVVGVGILAGRRTHADSEDYFLGKRELGPVLSALSSGASGSSAWVTMGLVGLAFTSGLRAFWLIPGVLIGISFNWFVLAGRMRDRAVELGAVTVPDLLSMHYGERAPVLRLMSVGVILSAMFLYVSAQMAAAGQMFAYVFDGLPYQAGVGIGVAIVLAYTVFGGFRSAVWTDMVQSSIMLVAMVMMPIVLLAIGAGGEAGVVATLRAADPGLVAALPEVSGLALVGFVLGSGALGVNLGYPGQPHVLVRLMALRDRRAIRGGSIIQISWTTLIYAGAIGTGVLVRAMAEGGTGWAAEIGAGETELAMIIAAGEVLPGVVGAFVLAAVVSAMASTADSQLIVAASAVSTDGYERVAGGTRFVKSLNRASVLALGIGAGVFVIDSKFTVYEYVLTYGWAILGASFGPQLALMLLWRGSSYAGAIAGMATGFVTAIAWKQLADRGLVDASFYNLTVAFVAALVVNVAVSLATKPRDA
ncbi:MAG: sodium/proline symporter [Planctomycetota bacterium]